MDLEKQFQPFSPPRTNLVEQVRYWASAQPEKLAFRFLTRVEENEESTLTYAELDQRARAIAAKLVSMGMVGQRALMLYPPGLEFVEAFMGCYYAGVIPVPAYPPRRNRNMSRITAISKDAQAAIALTVDSVISRGDDVVGNSPHLRSIQWLPTEKIPTELASDWAKPKMSGGDLGLIQYTSGSTGTPKGVMLTHQNLMANCAMISHAFGLQHDTVGLSCLLTYHDMGLIGGVLNTMFLGMDMTLMSPVMFLTRPLRWLEAISDYGVTVSGGPNFAYRWCIKKVKHEECETLDLSAWSVAFNGAEPVRADILEEFSKKFEPYGFRHTAHYPCYGMAETSLIVTGGNHKEPPVFGTFDRTELAKHMVKPVPEDHENSYRLVGCGQVIPTEEVIIVDPDKCIKLTDGRIGEIWIDSPSSGLGYWNRERETEDVFHGRLKQDNGKLYVRSGDLGFFNNGELFVTGRLKDMIVIRGVNRYPQDIESTVENCDNRLRSGGAAAFAVDHWDREHLVVVCEVERRRGSEWEPVLDQIKRAVIAEHDIPPDAVVLVRHNSVPKTSSGKVQRHACRQQFIDDQLQEIARWSGWEDNADTQQPIPTAKKIRANPSIPATNAIRSNGSAKSESNSDLVQVVMEHVRRVAKERAKELSHETNIVIDLGLDSLERLEIARELEITFGGRFPDEVLQEVETIGEVAAAITKHMDPSDVKPTVAPQPQNGGSNGGVIPESYFELEKMPEYIRFQRMKQMIHETGLRNPFFSVHEGRIGDTTQVDGRELISFASYNYLGLSGTDDVNREAKSAIDDFGTSVSASRIVSGEKTIHKQLEFEIAEFLGTEDVITFPGGHATNESVIGHLASPGDLVIHDSFAHNSIIQGAELSGARRRPFNHNDWKHLDEILTEIRCDYEQVIIAIEGLYSMDGDYPELDKFVKVKKRHKAWLYVDEAHSIGTLGETGRGIAEIYDVAREDVECWMGTLSKSFGSCGGFIAGKKALVEYLRYTTPGFVFAAGMPPANVGAARGALKALRKDPRLVTQLQKNSQLFLELAKSAGLDTGMCQGTPIIPIITRGSVLALALSEALFENGINAQPILYPAVPEHETRVRIFMTALHSEEQIRFSVDTIAREWARISGGARQVEAVSN